MKTGNRIRQALCRMPLVERALLPREEREMMARKRENFDRADRSVAAGLPELDSSPLQLQLELTNMCNIKCVMCPRLSDPRWLEHQKGHEGTLTLDTFRKLEPMLPGVVKCLLFGNGEPLMNPHFREILTILKQHAIHVSFNSNGLIMTEEYCHFFVDHAVDNITFSIDGATAETYNAIRLESDFDRVMANIRRLNSLRKKGPLGGKSKPNITIACVLMSANALEVPDMVNLTHEVGARILHFEPLLWFGHDRYEQDVHAKYRLSLVETDKIIELFDEAGRRAAKLGVEIVGPYVDERGRFVPEMLHKFDPKAEEFSV